MTKGTSFSYHSGVGNSNRAEIVAICRIQNAEIPKVVGFITTASSTVGRWWFLQPHGCGFESRNVVTSPKKEKPW